MSRMHLSTCVCAALCLVWTIPASAKLSHPGINLNIKELDLIKQEVNAKKQPRYSGWLLLKKRSEASLNYNPRGHTVVSRGGSGGSQKDLWSGCEAAYAHALQWYITGNEAHAKKAVQILNAWKILKTVKAEGKYNKLSYRLLSGWTCARLCMAAEIMRYTYRGWSAGDIAKFEAMLRRSFYPIVTQNPPTCRNPKGPGCVFGGAGKPRVSNWETSMLESEFAIAVFCDDQGMFNKAVERFKWTLPRYIKESGVNGETARDQSHAQMGIGSLAYAAEIAWHQGVDAYGMLNNRILKGFEYQSTRGVSYPCWEVPANHYINRRGIKSSAVEKARNKTRPEGVWFTRQFCYGTLTHAELNVKGGNPDVIVPLEPSTEAPDLEQPASEDPADFNDPHVKVNFGGIADGWVEGDAFAAGAQPFIFSSVAITEGVANAAPAEVYQTVVHRGESTDPLTISFPGITDGARTMRLHFTDTYGGRAIDVTAEGTKIVEALDPITEGGGEMKAVVIEKEITVTGGDGLQIVLDDSRPEPKDVFISAIEILGGTGGTSISMPLRRRIRSSGTVAGRTFSLSGRVTTRRNRAGSIILKIDNAATARRGIIR